MTSFQINFALAIAATVSGYSQDVFAFEYNLCEALELAGIPNVDQLTDYVLDTLSLDNSHKFAASGLGWNQICFNILRHNGGIMADAKDIRKSSRQAINNVVEVIRNKNSKVLFKIRLMRQFMLYKQSVLRAGDDKEQLVTLFLATLVDIITNSPKVTTSHHDNHLNEALIALCELLDASNMTAYTFKNCDLLDKYNSETIAFLKAIHSRRISITTNVRHFLLNRALKRIAETNMNLFSMDKLVSGPTSCGSSQAMSCTSSQQHDSQYAPVAYDEDSDFDFDSIDCPQWTDFQDEEYNNEDGYFTLRPSHWDDEWLQRPSEHTVTTATEQAAFGKH